MGVPSRRNKLAQGKRTRIVSQDDKRLNLTAFLIGLGSVVNFLLYKASAMSMLPAPSLLSQGLPALFLIAPLLSTLPAVFMPRLRGILPLCLSYCPRSAAFHPPALLQLPAAA